MKKHLKKRINSHHSLLCIGLLVSLVIGCAQKETLSERNALTLRQRLLMGTLVSVQLPSKHSHHVEPVFSLFSDLDSKLSAYKPNSEVSLLNQGKKISPSPQTLEIFSKAIQLNRITNGFFNIFVGKKTIESRQNPHLLTLKRIKFLKQERYQFEAKKLSLKKGNKIDLGGIAKGYAVDKSLQILKRNKVSQVQVSASGDIGCLGACELYIQHPLLESRLASFTSAKARLAISTSGNYRKSSLYHIVNPKTGKYVNHWLSVTLLGESDNTTLDGLTTSVFSMPNKLALDFLKRNQIPFLLIDHNRNVYVSDNLGSLIKDFKWVNTKDLKIKNKDKERKI